MKDVITVETMRRSDAHTIAQYVPGEVLMHRAAMGVFRAAQWKGSVGILTGGGNNGGDGYALACILAGEKIPCRVYRVSEKFSEDGKYYHDKALAAGVEILPYTEETDLSDHGTLVDCLLGTGFSGPVKGLFRTAIQAMNAAPAQVVSVDINSGLNGDTGKGDVVVKSHLTVTIGYLKAGLFLGEALWNIGRLAVADIGIRLVREDFFLAAAQEVVFPHTAFTLEGDQVVLLTPGEAEDLAKNGQTLPEVAQELALRRQKLIRVLGKNSLVTDGYRTYFLEEGTFPQEIGCLDC